MAHASVASLSRTIESLFTSHSPMQSLICDHRDEICAIHEKVSSLEVFVKNFEKNNVSGEMTDFEVEVKEVANDVECTIQLRLTETVLVKNKSQKKKARRRFRQSLKQVAEDMDRIWKESTKIQDKGKQVSKESLVHDFSSPTNDILNVNNNMVGRDDQKEHLLENLTGSYSGEPKVIPIVGMHNRKEILLGLLRTTIKMDDTVKTKGEAELADMLQKSLKRKRYLIVLDDIWSCEVWDGSISMQMDFMDQDESWNLFKSAAFSSEALPYEFDTVGKQIADDSHGLPLTIVVVAGLLKSKRAIEDWRSVAKDVKSFITNDPDERCSQDSEIGVKKLMSIWMAEGFLKLENDLEGEAEKCLKKLVDRCLVINYKKSLDGTKIRSCKVHDLIYGLCLREIQRENIFIMNNIVLGVSHSKKQPFVFYRALLTPVHRQLRDQDNNVLLKRTHSIFSFHLEDSIFSVLKLKLIRVKLLKVLELRHIEVDDFPVQILSLIWLRHLKLPTIFLPNPPSISVDKGSHMGFSNLQTISYLSLDCCSKEVIMGIQNVKKLGIRGYETDSNSIRDSGFLNNLVHLQQLETLSFIGCFPLLPSSAKAFPATLKKLKLGETYISWSYLDIVAELPNLEVLKLMDFACDGNEWYPNVRGFTRLKLWKATNDNFPVLERLVLKGCTFLKDIPIEFAEIHTLQLIELTRCLRELEESAARIQQEQEELGNNPVDVRISDLLMG
ncbi:hypothetical protein P3S67_008507 [Capsicum chacoense]